MTRMTAATGQPPPIEMPPPLTKPLNWQPGETTPADRQLNTPETRALALGVQTGQVNESDLHPVRQYQYRNFIDLLRAGGPAAVAAAGNTPLRQLVPDLASESWTRQPTVAENFLSGLTEGLYNPRKESMGQFAAGTGRALLEVPGRIEAGVTRGVAGIPAGAGRALSVLDPYIGSEFGKRGREFAEAGEAAASPMVYGPGGGYQPSLDPRLGAALEFGGSMVPLGKAIGTVASRGEQLLERAPVIGAAARLGAPVLTGARAPATLAESVAARTIPPFIRSQAVMQGISPPITEQGKFDPQRAAENAAIATAFSGLEIAPGAVGKILSRLRRAEAPGEVPILGKAAAAGAPPPPEAVAGPASRLSKISALLDELDEPAPAAAVSAPAPAAPPAAPDAGLAAIISDAREIMGKLGIKQQDADGYIARALAKNPNPSDVQDLVRAAFLREPAAATATQQTAAPPNVPVTEPAPTTARPATVPVTETPKPAPDEIVVNGKVYREDKFNREDYLTAGDFINIGGKRYVPVRTGLSRLIDMQMPSDEAPEAVTASLLDRLKGEEEAGLPPIPATTPTTAPSAPPAGTVLASQPEQTTVRPPAAAEGLTPAEAAELETLENQYARRIGYQGRGGLSAQQWDRFMQLQHTNMAVIAERIAHPPAVPTPTTRPPAATETVPPVGPASLLDRLKGEEEAGASTRLPSDLAGAKPHYSFGNKQFQLAFGDDIDKAAFITAQAKKSKRDADFRAYLESQGMNASQIEEHGAHVKDTINGMARVATDGETLTIPRHDLPPTFLLDRLRTEEAGTAPPAETTAKTPADFIRDQMREKNLAEAASKSPITPKQIEKLKARYEKAELAADAAEEKAADSGLDRHAEAADRAREKADDLAAELDTLQGDYEDQVDRLRTGEVAAAPSPSLLDRLKSEEEASVPPGYAVAAGRTAAGGILGLLAGSRMGDTEEERRANALNLGLLGAGLGIAPNVYRALRGSEIGAKMSAIRAHLPTRGNLDIARAETQSQIESTSSTLGRLKAVQDAEQSGEKKALIAIEIDKQQARLDALKRSASLQAGLTGQGYTTVGEVANQMIGGGLQRGESEAGAPIADVAKLRDSLPRSTRKAFERGGLDDLLEGHAWVNAPQADGSVQQVPVPVAPATPLEAALKAKMQADGEQAEAYAAAMGRTGKRPRADYFPRILNVPVMSDILTNMDTPEGKVRFADLVRSLRFAWPGETQERAIADLTRLGDEMFTPHAEDATSPATVQVAARYGRIQLSRVVDKLPDFYWDSQLGKQVPLVLKSTDQFQQWFDHIKRTYTTAELWKELGPTGRKAQMLVDAAPQADREAMASLIATATNGRGPVAEDFLYGAEDLPGRGVLGQSMRIGRNLATATGLSLFTAMKHLPAVGLPAGRYGVGSFARAIAPAVEAVFPPALARATPDWLAWLMPKMSDSVQEISATTTQMEQALRDKPDLLLRSGGLAGSSPFTTPQAAGYGSVLDRLETGSALAARWNWGGRMTAFAMRFARAIGGFASLDNANTLLDMAAGGDRQAASLLQKRGVGDAIGRGDFNRQEILSLVQQGANSIPRMEAWNVAPAFSTPTGALLGQFMRYPFAYAAESRSLLADALERGNAGTIARYAGVTLTSMALVHGLRSMMEGRGIPSALDTLTTLYRDLPFVGAVEHFGGGIPVPAIGVASRVAQDAYRIARYFAGGGTQPPSASFGDITRMAGNLLPPGAGPILQHLLFPTRADLASAAARE